MGLALDTSVLIAAERGRIDLAALLSAESPNVRALLPALAASELLHGLERASPRHKPARLVFIEMVFANSAVLSFDFECARVHARIWAQLESKGARIGPHDLIIAATALAHGHRIATLNVSEFSRIDDLTVVDASAYSIQ